MTAKTEAEALPPQYIYRYEIRLAIQTTSLRKATDIALLAADVAGFCDECKVTRVVSCEANNNPPQALQEPSR